MNKCTAPFPIVNRTHFTKSCVLIASFENQQISVDLLSTLNVSISREIPP